MHAATLCKTKRDADSKALIVSGAKTQKSDKTRNLDKVVKPFNYTYNPNQFEAIKNLRLNILKFLMTLERFKDWQYEDLNDLNKSMEFCQIPEGTTLYSIKDKPEYFYIVLKGA